MRLNHPMFPSRNSKRVDALADRCGAPIGRLNCSQNANALRVLSQSENQRLRRSNSWDPGLAPASNRRNSVLRRFSHQHIADTVRHSLPRSHHSSDSDSWAYSSRDLTPVIGRTVTARADTDASTSPRPTRCRGNSSLCDPRCALQPGILPLGNTGPPNHSPCPSRNISAQTIRRCRAV